MTDEQRERAENRRKELENNRQTYGEQIRADIIGYDGTEPRKNFYRRFLRDCLERYFRNRDIPIEGLKFQKVPSSVYADAFRFCHDEIVESGHRIDLDNTEQLNDFAEAYNDIVNAFSIKAHPTCFCKLIDIDLMTFDRWKNDTQKAVLFLDSRGDRIGGDNPELYRRAHPDEIIREVLSPSRGEISRKVSQIYTTSAENALNDTPLGLTVNANHSKRMGLEYQKQTMLEGAQIQQALSANELPRLSLESGANAEGLPDLSQT